MVQRARCVSRSSRMPRAASRCSSNATTGACAWCWPASLSLWAIVKSSSTTRAAKPAPARWWASSAARTGLRVCDSELLGPLEEIPQPLLRVGIAGAQVHAAIAQVPEHVLDHAAAMLGGQAVERAAEGVREVRLVDHAMLVQRLDDHDVGGGKADERLDERRLVHPASRAASSRGSVRASVASSPPMLTGVATQSVAPAARHLSRSPIIAFAVT